jgi:hypothetical protein
MRLKITSIIACISILGYVAAIGLGAYRVSTNITERQRIAGQEFYSLVDRAADAARTSGFMEEPFRETLRDLVIASQTLQGLIITGPFGNEFSYERERGKVISWTADIPRFKVQFGISHEPFFSPLSVEGTRNVTISAVASYIDYPSLIETLKLSFVVIAAALLLSFLALIVDIATSGPKVPGAKAKASAKAHGAKAPTILPKNGLETPTQPPLEDVIDFDELTAGLSAVKAQSAEFEPQTGPEPAPGLDIPEFPAQLPPEALDPALEMAAVTDQDLVLMIMEISESGELFRGLKEKAAEFFPPPAAISDRGPQGLAVIIPGQGLERGFARAEEFHSLIYGAFPGILVAKTDFRIGLSARTGRQIEGGRLTREASKALEKTLEDGVPIVAFKSDPEKYKAFLDKQGN